MTCIYVFSADTGDEFPRAVRDLLVNSPKDNNNDIMCDALCCKYSSNNNKCKGKMAHEIVENMARAT